MILCYGLSVGNKIPAEWKEDAQQADQKIEPPPDTAHALKQVTTSSCTTRALLLRKQT